VFFCLLTAVLLFSVSLWAQHPYIAKIGRLRGRSATSSGSELLQKALRDVGYIEGKNIVFESRSAENKLDRLPALAEELVRLKVDLLLASSTDEALAFRNATQTIPIVFYTGGDPVALGLIKSLARPGGNITGFSMFGSELTGKRLDLLKEALPQLARVGVLWDPTFASAFEQWKECQAAARELGLQLKSLEVSSVEHIEAAFKEARKFMNALAVIQTPLINSNQRRIVDLAAKNRLPAMYSRSEFVENGGLMSYGADLSESYRRVARMIEKILKGTKPADIPVEQPTKFELVINLKTAKQIGFTIPPNVLARADRVIR
jgi:ABC-type uncharacterized transport system substrate-binding protein